MDTCQEIKNYDLAYLSALDAVKCNQIIYLYLYKAISMSAIDEILLVLEKDPEVSDVKF